MEKNITLKAFIRLCVTEALSSDAPDRWSPEAAEARKKLEQAKQQHMAAGRELQEAAKHLATVTAWRDTRSFSDRLVMRLHRVVDLFFHTDGAYYEQIAKHQHMERLAKLAAEDHWVEHVREPMLFQSVNEAGNKVLSGVGWSGPKVYESVK